MAQQPSSIVALSALYLIPLDEAATVARGIASSTRRDDGGGWMQQWTSRVLSTSLSGFLVYSVFHRIKEQSLDIDVDKYVRLLLELGGLCAFPIFLRHFSATLYPGLTLDPAGNNPEARNPEMLRAKHDAEMKEIKDLLKERDSKHDAEMKERDSKHDAEMKERDSKHDAEMKERDSKHDAEMKARDEKHDAEMKELKDLLTERG